tara:strand:+ start:272 stop:553 length:282 start_codon:yes stop_codon:yes gene_type:complete
MKKVFILIFASFFLANPLFALSNDFWNAIFNGCYSGSDKTQFWKSYCTCYTDKFDAKYNNEQIIIFLEATEGTDLSKHPLVKKFSKECFDKVS